MRIYSSKAISVGVALAAMVVLGCADERRDNPVFLDDLNDVDRFPSDDRQQLKAEHDNLPRNVVVRVPVDDKGEPRSETRAEVKHFDANLDLKQLSGERMGSVWGRGRVSDRTRLEHNLRHVARDHKYGRNYSTQHDIGSHRRSYKHGRHHNYYRRGYRHGRYRGYRHGYRYDYSRPFVYGYNKYRYSPPKTYFHRYYRPYYRSSYRPNLWWGNYRFYNAYHYQPSGYRYFVYCPNTYCQNYTTTYY